MEIKSAEFVISNTKVELCPKGELPEYAFIGRSNVGKSSLINMLTKRSKLAMTSATPGKTLLINHFLINKEWYLVDLPGYGYAARGKQQVEKIQKIISEVLGVDEDSITMDTTFVDDLGADSLDVFQIIMALEEEFDIEIPAEAAESYV